VGGRTDNSQVIRADSPAATMPDLPATGWFVARGRDEDGPYTLARLRQLGRQGWLAPADLVWHPALPAWTPAGEVEGLFAVSLAKRLGRMLPGFAGRRGLAESARPGRGQAKSAQPGRGRDLTGREGAAPASRPKAAPRSSQGFFRGQIDLRPRHLAAAAAGLVTALGLAFFAIAPSVLARGLTAGGLLALAGCLAPELARLLAWLAVALERWRQAAAERRHQMEESVLEQQRLADGAALVAEEQRRRNASWAEPYRPERIVVVTEEPVRLWSRWKVTLASLLVPGLGQYFKGEVPAAVAWFVCVVTGYFLHARFGIVMHLMCAVAAASGNPWTEGRTTVVRE